MTTLQARADDFLTGRRIAVAGVSRSGQATGNGIYDALRQNGYEVFALNPHAESINGQPCYASLRDIPGGVDTVIAVTSPDITAQIARDAYEAGVRRLWVHNNTLTPSSGSPAITAYCQEHGIEIIDKGCPMMFMHGADGAHRFMCRFLQFFGRLPR